jgi:hypothetical protein
MHISEKLRDTIYSNKDTGTVFLHVPKTGGTSFIKTLEKNNIPTLNYKLIINRHSMHCNCSELICMESRNHEREFIEAMVNLEKPWVLDMGHNVMTNEDALDIPQEMKIVTILRHSSERIISLFLFNVMQFDYAMNATMLISPKLSLISNWREMKFEIGKSEIKLKCIRLQNILSAMGRLMDENRKSWDVHKWVQTALNDNKGYPFWYTEFLPQINACDDSRLKRLESVHFKDINDFMKLRFNVNIIKKNVSKRVYAHWDIEKAVQELNKVAPVIAKRDNEMWNLLNRYSYQISKR